MAKVVWDRREDIANEYRDELIPYRTTYDKKNFRPPSTIKTDFERYLMHDVPHVLYTYELLHSWYDKDKEDYEPVYIRAQQTSIDWKSKIGNSDMSTNFKTDYGVKIRKGDIVIREDGILYLLNWNVQEHPNNQATQSTECNAIVDFTREFDDIVDKRGYLILKGGRRNVVTGMPVVHVEYQGRPDFIITNGNPGIVPDHLITLTMQWNEQTKNIIIGDQFIIGTYTYRVVNTSIAEVNIDKDYGIFTINAKRVAGGGVKDE